MFLVTKGRSLPYEQNNYTQMDLVFTRDLGHITIQRNHYSILDIISDVGGLLGILMTVISVFMYGLNYNQLDNHMVSKLYQTVQQNSLPIESAEIKRKCSDSLIELVRAILPKCRSKKLCCRLDRRARTLLVAREMLE